MEPFADFLRRYGKQALLILALIGVYRISDVVMGIMANPFYVDMGYTKDEVVRAVTKVYGVIMTLVGAFSRRGALAALGRDAGADARRRALGGEQPAVRLAGRARPRCDGVDRRGLGRQPERGRGLGSVYRLPVQPDQCDVFEPREYALFSSMMLLAPKWLAGYSGAFVDTYDYPTFFTATAFLGVPVLLLIWLATRLDTPPRRA